MLISIFWKWSGACYARNILLNTWACYLGFIAYQQFKKKKFQNIMVGISNICFILCHCSLRLFDIFYRTKSGFILKRLLTIPFGKIAIRLNLNNLVLDLLFLTANPHLVPQPRQAAGLMSNYIEQSLKRNY
jgi:hypothetical protein